MKMDFIGIYNLPFGVTILGLWFALWACILSYQDRFELSVICFVLAGLCDLFDGVVARRSKRSDEEERFGLYIDSTVDAISFGFVPIMILLHSGFDTTSDYFLYAFYCFSAVIRLSYFNLLNDRRQGVSGYYTGLPVTYSALVLPLVWTIGLFIPKTLSDVLVRLALFLLAFFFVLKVPIKKPGGVFYIIFPLLGLLLIGFWIARVFRLI